MRAKNFREKIASQAARLMCDATLLSYESARQEAVRMLGFQSLFPRQLPTKKEIREKVLLLSRDQQTLLRRQLFEELLFAMRYLQAFNPQVDAKLLTASIAADAQYVIEIFSTSPKTVIQSLPKLTQVSLEKYLTTDSSIRTQAEAWPIDFEGTFLLALRICKREQNVLQRPHVGIIELESEVKLLVANGESNVPEIDTASQDRFGYFATLLWPLEQVLLSPIRHPEGDALYHSLQVFQLAFDERSYDEEFLLAALLHDVGKAIDPENHVAAGLAALHQFISSRTATLIDLHPQAHFYRDGTLGMRARRRLEANPDFEDLLLLAECDKNGRRCGVPVPDVEHALEQIRAISDTFSE